MLFNDKCAVLKPAVQPGILYIGAQCISIALLLGPQANTSAHIVVTAFKIITQQCISYIMLAIGFIIVKSSTVKIAGAGIVKPFKLQQRSFRQRLGVADVGTVAFRNTVQACYLVQCIP